MAPTTLGTVLRHMHQLAAGEHRSDRELLEAFAGRHDEDAFAALVRRHGPLVLRVCRHLLHHEQDAEDVFQATFLVLAMKASSIRNADTLASFLHGIAYRLALRARRDAARRRAREARTPVPPPTEAPNVSWREVQAILEEEIERLPEKYRLPFLLCHVQGLSRAEAARKLAIKEGTVWSRLNEARSRLQERLAQRGVALAAVLGAVALSGSATAAVPIGLLDATVRCARLLAAGSVCADIVSVRLAVLVHAGLRSLAAAKVKLGLGVFAVWLAVAGAAGLMGQVRTAQSPQTAAASSLPQANAAETPGRSEPRTFRVDRHGDPLPAGALARLGTTRLRHTSQVNSVLFAPDGKTVASAGMDDTVRLWDAVTGKLVRSLKHPKYAGVIRPRLLSFAQDGKTLTSAVENQVLLWDVRTGQQLREVMLGQIRIALLAISSDGKTAVSGGEDGGIRLWDVASGEQLHVLQEHGKLIHSLSFSPDNKTLASGADGDGKGIVRLWDVPSGKLLHKLEHPQVVWQGPVAFSPDGKTLASGGTDKSIQGPLKPERKSSAVRFWDVATGKLLRTLERHQQTIAALSFSPDGKVLASGSWQVLASGRWDRTIRLWDVTAGKELRKLKCPGVSSLSFSPDGKVLASRGDDGPAVRLWDVTTGKELHRPQGAHKGQVNFVSFSPDGRTLATAAVGKGDEEDTVRLWDAISGKPLRKLEHPGGARSVVFAPDGKTLASGGADVVCIWDTTTGKQLRKLEARGGSLLAFSPDGKTLVAGSRNGCDLAGGLQGGALRFWDVATGTQLRNLEHPLHTTSVAFSPDGKTLAVGTRGEDLYLWDAATGKELLKLGKHPGPWGEIVTISFSPDGKTLAVGSYDNKIHLLEVATGKEFHTLTGHSGHIWAVAFSPNGRWLASGGVDQTVRLWEVNAGLASPCHQFRGHAAGVTAVAFSPDGQRLASSSLDSTALVWDVTGQAGKQTHAARLTPGELTALWQSLIDTEDTDAGRAYQAMRTLAAAPDQTVPFLAGRLFLKKPDPQQVARLLADLDSEDFRVRSQAAKEIEKLGEAAEPYLRQALKDKPSVEVRRHILQLLEALDPPHPEGVSPPRLLRWLRAVEVLEWIASLATRELLEKWAADPPREEVGREAKAALKRLRVLGRP